MVNTHYHALPVSSSTTTTSFDKLITQIRSLNTKSTRIADGMISVEKPLSPVSAS